MAPSVGNRRGQCEGGRERTLRENAVFEMNQACKHPTTTTSAFIINFSPIKYSTINISSGNKVVLFRVYQRKPLFCFYVYARVYDVELDFDTV